jgi:hypothetical protein
MIDRHAEGWTPTLVKERLIEAVRWARYNVGPTGPAPIRSAMPSYTATLEDHLAEGWGFPEQAEDNAPDEKVLRINLPPEKVQQLIDALEWCAKYLAADHPGSARMLNLWVRCRVYKADFNRNIEARGLSRSHAYRLRDRGLSVIAQALAANRVPL